MKLNGQGNEAMVEVPEPIWTALCRKVDALEAEVSELRTQAPAPPSAAVPSPPAPDGIKPLGRRAAMATLAGAAAAVGTGALVLGGAEPAAAANGNNLVIGSTPNSASARTTLAVT